MKLTPNVIFNDNMVLQRRKPVPVYGHADAGVRIFGSFAGAEADTVSAADGSWELSFPAMEAGGPYEMILSDGSETVTYSNVFSGDVWLCSGQSNMVTPMERVRFTYPEEVASPYGGPVHMLSIPENAVFEGPSSELPHGNWQVAATGDFLEFSAVAWFFGCMINREEKVPVGLIVSAVGGTPIQSWLPRHILEALPQKIENIEAFRSESYRISLAADEQKITEGWLKELDAGDPGLNGAIPWFDPSFDCSDWETVTVPNGPDWVPWEIMGEGDEFGSYWFQLDLDIPESLAGRKGLVWLGRIIDADTVWLNGRRIGDTAYQYPPRIYPVPEGLLKAGKNRLTVRVQSQSSPWSFVPDKPYYLEIGSQRIPLDGRWYYRQGKTMGAFPPSTRLVVKPECLFNGMIAPVLRTPITGVLWYQGESNMGNAPDYGVFLEHLMDEWRRLWDEPELPFIIAQLPCYGPDTPDMYDSLWAVIRNHQRIMSGKKAAALATTLDCGEWNDIHPLRKRPVGERLAAAALNLVYGRSEFSQGPKPVETVRSGQGNRIGVRFSSVREGLDVRGDIGDLHLFIKGSEGDFSKARASVEGEWLFVDTDVKGVCTLRYGWAENPRGAYLYGKSGYPVSPFELTVD